MEDINEDIEEEGDDEEEDEDDEIIPDIDSQDLNNPLAVVEYVEEIHGFYWRSEVRSISSLGVYFKINMDEKSIRVHTQTFFHFRSI